MTVLVILVAMLVIIAIAGLVIVYTVFPHRGQKMPYVSGLGSAMERAVDTAPTLGPARRLQQRPREYALADLFSDPEPGPAEKKA